MVPFEEWQGSKEYAKDVALIHGIDGHICDKCTYERLSRDTKWEHEMSCMCQCHVRSNPKKYSLEAFKAGAKPPERPEPPQPPQELNFAIGKTISLPGPELCIFPIESRVDKQIAFVFKFPGNEINYNYPDLRFQVAIALATTRHGNLGGFLLNLDDGQKQVFYTDVILPDQLLMAHFMEVFSQSKIIHCIFVQANKVARIWVVPNLNEESKKVAKQTAEYIRDNPVPLDNVCFKEAKADFDKELGIATIKDFARLFPVRE